MYYMYYMVEESIVSLRVDKKLHAEMKLHDEINWSALLRKSIIATVNDFDSIDKNRAQKAALSIDKLRKSNAFSTGKESNVIIREWRNKRR